MLSLATTLKDVSVEKLGGDDEIIKQKVFNAKSDKSAILHDRKMPSAYM